MIVANGAMITLMKSWWLLALCGVLDAIVSVIYLILQNQDRPLVFHTWKTTLLFLGLLTFSAGVCTIAAAIWSFGRGKPWLLVLNGLACGALGLIFTLWRGPLAFRTVALLIVVMAISLGIYVLAIARTLRRDGADEWLLSLAAVSALGFAVAFSGFVLRWMKLDPASPGQSLRWVGCYFGFSAICTPALALGLHRLRVSQSGQWEDLPALGNPKHAH